MIRVLRVIRVLGHWNLRVGSLAWGFGLSQHLAERTRPAASDAIACQVRAGPRHRRHRPFSPRSQNAGSEIATEMMCSGSPDVATNSIQIGQQGPLNKS